jgi:hypothetical protein
MRLAHGKKINQEETEMTKPRPSRPKETKPTPASVAQPAIASSPRAKVFISHDSRDADLAEAFGNLLMDASGGILKSFRSSDRRGTAGIEFGEEWYSAIMSSLKDATDVVALLTPHSVNRPWILYEAGVAKGKLDSKVLGVAIGIPLEKASTGPFAQFQNSDDDVDSLTKLVLQLIRKNPEAAPREEAVVLQVEAFKSKVTEIMKQRSDPAHEPPGHVEETAVAKMFEEVKVMYASLPDKIQAMLLELKRPRRSLRRMMHPRMFEELMFNPERQDPSGMALGWLVVVSSFRDDMPWLYDLGMEVYHAICTEDTQQMDSAARKFSEAVEIVIHGPLSEMFIEDKETHMIMRHLPEILHSNLAIIRESMERRKRPVLRKLPKHVFEVDSGSSKK